MLPRLELRLECFQIFKTYTIIWGAMNTLKFLKTGISLVIYSMSLVLRSGCTVEVVTIIFSTKIKGLLGHFWLQVWP